MGNKECSVKEAQEHMQDCIDPPRSHQDMGLAPGATRYQTAGDEPRPTPIGASTAQVRGGDGAPRADHGRQSLPLEASTPPGSTYSRDSRGSGKVSITGALSVEQAGAQGGNRGVSPRVSRTLPPAPAAFVDDGAGVGSFDDEALGDEASNASGKNRSSGSMGPPPNAGPAGRASASSPLAGLPPPPPPPGKAVEEAAPQPAPLPSKPDVTLSANYPGLPKTYFDHELGEGPMQAEGAAGSGRRERRLYVFPTGARYDGEWLSGMRDGMGKQTWTDGTEYVGQWRRGRAGGYGYIRHADGDTYSGEWVNGRAHGFGTYIFQGGDGVYRGAFRCDMREGVGVEEWVDGSCYRGEFRRGDKHGFGENLWPDGTVYVGGWKSNELYGAGHFSIEDGPSYRGEWSGSRPHGTGLYKWASGRTYAGQYVFDKKDGFGILTEADSTSVQAFWVRGERVSES